jgi:hypothetical protein
VLVLEREHQGFVDQLPEDDLAGHALPTCRRPCRPGGAEAGTRRPGRAFVQITVPKQPLRRTSTAPDVASAAGVRQSAAASDRRSTCRPPWHRTCSAKCTKTAARMCACSPPFRRPPKLADGPVAFGLSVQPGQRTRTTSPAPRWSGRTASRRSSAARSPSGGDEHVATRTV